METLNFKEKIFKKYNEIIKKKDNSITEKEEQYYNLLLQTEAGEEIILEKLLCFFCDDIGNIINSDKTALYDLSYHMQNCYTCNNNDISLYHIKKNKKVIDLGGLCENCYTTQVFPIFKIIY